MEDFISFLTNDKVVWCYMSFLVFLITLGLKIPYKKLTSNITSEKLRQFANKAIVVFTFAISIGLNVTLAEWTNIPFSFEDSIKHALSAIALYSALEIKGNPFKNAEAEELIDKAEDVVNNKGTDEESATSKFLKHMGEKK